MVNIRRIYDSPTPSSGDGKRVLVDRLWPRGLRKDEVVIDKWMKDVSPSSQLRKWFGHDPARWEIFKERYRQELGDKKELLDELRIYARHHTLTLLYSAKDTEHNNAVVIKEMIDQG
ncbi:MAG: hypothetical protein A4E65_00964 [Syntrophorhabdus sp. PtaU1.Bin153]|nr:MAG: hypothetical protein A4E65_00964 [Syntrophorhabdus sp. PtaU1.Bin153]